MAGVNQGDVHMKIAYSGIEGAFANIAARRVFLTRSLCLMEISALLMKL